MRIASGKFKNRRLATPPGSLVRPTGERARQALFNILGDRVVGARFLDLFAGTGAIGLEALSRGASQVVFVESDRQAEKTLKHNIGLCAAAATSAVHRLDITRVLPQFAQRERPFDIVFADPPYDFLEYRSLVDTMTGPQLLAENGIAVLEHRRGVPPPATSLASNTRQYGENAFTFYHAL
ncbi:MAG: 16S rRNA (guanine(966)-N(2))-methyltransferase RsmD [Candidatus Hydrogenedentota bacterium]